MEPVLSATAAVSSKPPLATRALYVGIFLVTFATLALQILLTRIFNVTLMYHFAFLAISIAMFGLTVGALVVQLRPGWFMGKVRLRLAQCALVAGISAVAGTALHLYIPFTPDFSLSTLAYLVPTILMFLIPFSASGICVTLVLTRYPDEVGRLYAADLIGAALGCVGVIGIMEISGARGGIVAVGLLMAAAAYAFAYGQHMLRPVRSVALIGMGLSAMLLIMAFMDAASRSTAKEAGNDYYTPIYEKWTALSRVVVQTYPEIPFGWGFGGKFPLARVRVPQLMLNMDNVAGTVLTRYSGDPKSVAYLKFDVTNIAHHLRPDADVLVVGVGGGRDILSALAFRQRSILGVEMNGAIVDTLTRHFAGFTGNLAGYPNVRLVNDEARSYVARQNSAFDIIQVSLIDTWAATAAGAFVFSENTLYTEEAWDTFLRKLTPNGVLSFSRWYFENNPGEIYRLAALAANALQKQGIGDISRHILAARSILTSGNRTTIFADGVGTVLVSRAPFSDIDVSALARVSEQLGFEVIISPDHAKDEVLGTIIAGRADAAFFKSLPIDVTPPTDDSPFFFNMLRFRDVLDPARWELGPNSFNMKAVALLGSVFAVVITLAALCILIPWFAARHPAPAARKALHLSFFAAIGLGFLMVELAQLQRLMIFLGHPLYGLSVVLFSLLLGSGLGSFLTDRIARHVSMTIFAFIGIILVLTLAGLVTDAVIQALRAASTPVRIAVAVSLVFPLGVVMGMAWPLGMKLASASVPDLVPWFWGVNGAMSVFASVSAVLVSLAFGIAATFWTGVVCYLAAAVIYFRMLRHFNAAGFRAVAMPG